MIRGALLERLRCYEPWDAREAWMTSDLRRFVEANPTCFSRGLPEGHITGSAWILNRTGSSVLLVHHAKLDKWLQPGGHCDPGETACQAAMREAFEETGVDNLILLREDIFDIDVHPIPARKSEGAHLHYDVRYAFQSRSHSELIVSPESRDVRWVPLEQVQILNHEESLMRMVQKTQTLRAL